MNVPKKNDQYFVPDEGFYPLGYLGLATRHVANLLGKYPSNIDYMCAKGKLDHFCANGRRFIHESEVARLKIEAGEKVISYVIDLGVGKITAYSTEILEKILNQRVGSETKITTEIATLKSLPRMPKVDFFISEHVTVMATIFKTEVSITKTVRGKMCCPKTITKDEFDKKSKDFTVSRLTLESF